MSAPSSRTVPPVGSSSRTTHRPTVDLPEPLSPTRASDLALRDRQRDPVDGAHRAEVLDQIVDLERGGARRGSARVLVPWSCPASSGGRLGGRAASRSPRRVPAATSVPAGGVGTAASGGCEAGSVSSAAGSGRRRCSASGESRSTGTRPGISRSRRRAGVPARVRRRAEQPVRCSGAAGGRTGRVDAAPLDDAAGVHDDDPVGDVGDHAEVVGDEQDAGAEPVAQVAQHVEDAGLHGDVERGRRLVGDQQLGLAGHRHRDHHALAHAAGELVRVLLDPLRGGRDADQLRAARSPASRAAGGEALVRRSTSPICRPTVSTGFSEVIGSWKMYAMSRPRTARSARSLAPTSSVPVQPDRAGDRRALRGQQPGERHRGDALAAAGLADDAEDLARRRASKSTPSTASTGAVLGAEATVRSRTSRTGGVVAGPCGGDGASSAAPFGSRASRRRVAEQVEREGEQHDREAGDDRHPRARAANCWASDEHHAQARGRAAGCPGRGTTAPPRR